MSSFSPMKKLHRKKKSKSKKFQPKNEKPQSENRVLSRFKMKMKVQNVVPMRNFLFCRIKLDYLVPSA